jgi:hypothetical protein
MLENVTLQYSKKLYTNYYCIIIVVAYELQYSSFKF